MLITDLRSHIVWASERPTWSMEAAPRRTWLFVEVLTDEGLVGFGEGSQSRNDAGVAHEVERLRSYYVGHNPLDLIARRQALLEWPYVGRTRFAAVSAIEQAVWDLCGKYLGAPVYQLLGGACQESVRVYANIGYAVERSEPEELARVASEAVADGNTAIKFYPFGEAERRGSPNQRRWIERGVANVRTVREAIGPDVDVLVDLMHQFAELRQAVAVARQLEPFDLFWIEDPFTWDDPRRLAEFRQAVGRRIAGGAPHLAGHEFRPLFEAGAMDVIMPDLKWLGGILQSKKVAAAAEFYGVMCSPHNASGPVSCAASVHLSCGLSNFLVLEYPWRGTPWREELCGGTERLYSGTFPLPAAPGLGVELDQKTLARYRVDG